MNVDRLLKLITLLCMVAIIVLLLYAWFVAIPEQTELFKACEEKVLCQNKILTGAVCDRYIAKTYGINYTTIP